MLFEVELEFEGVVDRFDDLPQWFEEAGSRAFGFALAGRFRSPIVLREATIPVEAAARGGDDGRLSCVKRAGSGRASRVEVGEVLRAADTLADPGYAAAFAVTIGPPARSPEQWARIVFEDAPLVLRWFVVLGWKIVLALRLGPRRSPDHVLGWKIQANAPDSMTLEVRSALFDRSQGGTGR